MRPHQWTKNLLVWVAYLFTAGWHHPGWATLASLTFLAFCCASSGVYIFNDLADIDRDRQHPRKRFRPLASGKVPKLTGIVLGTALGLASFAIALAVNIQTFAVLAVYAGLQVAYNLRLKHEPVLDVFLVAAGFVLRSLAGAVAIQVPLSGWLLVCTGLMALFLGFAKRRSEQVSVSGTGTREVLTRYGGGFLDHALTLTATSTMVSYAVYVIASTTASKHPYLVFTLPFVAFSLLRYMFLTLSAGEGGEPDILLFKDPQIAICLILYTAIAVYAMSQTEANWLLTP